ncbi:MAG: aminodeoxychorismate lyase [Rhodospirillaceae bacterium]
MIRVNGMASDVVPATDRGLAYGDGVFRTLAVRAGRVVHWDRQYAKLASDCARLGIACPPSEILLEDVDAVTAAQRDAAVKIIVTRGTSERGYRIPPNPHVNRVVIASPLPAYPEGHASQGVAAYLCETRLGSQSALAGVKHLNRLENVLARAEWSTDAYAEGILRDVEGNVVGGTMTNLFLIEAGRLVTPELTRCGVAGMTRDLVLERAARDGVGCNIETISLERLLAADEAFVVNSLIGIWPLRAIGNVALRTGSMAQRVRAWLD